MAEKALIKQAREDDVMIPNDGRSGSRDSLPPPSMERRAPRGWVHEAATNGLNR